MIEYDFDIFKFRDIITYALIENDGRIEFDKLNNLLYLIDRKAILENNYIITEDTYILITNKSKHFCIILNNYHKLFNIIDKKFSLEKLLFDNLFVINFDNNYNKILYLRNKDNVYSFLTLCKRTKEIIKEIISKYKNISNEEIVKEIESFNEIKFLIGDIINYNIEEHKFINDVYINDILINNGYSKEQVEEIEEEENYHTYFNRELNKLKI